MTPTIAAGEAKVGRPSAVAPRRRYCPSHEVSDTGCLGIEPEAHASDLELWKSAQEMVQGEEPEASEPDGGDDDEPEVQEGEEPSQEENGVLRCMVQFDDADIDPAKNWRQHNAIFRFKAAGRPGVDWAIHDEGLLFG